jgi:hypothetical protein
MLLSKKPALPEDMGRSEDTARAAGTEQGSSPEMTGGGQAGPPIPKSLDRVEQELRRELGNESADIIIRRLVIGTEPELDAILFYVEGLTDRNTINLMALRSVMLSGRGPRLRPEDMTEENVARVLMTHLLPSGQATLYDTLDSVISRVLAGETALFIEGSPKCIVFETKGWEHRNVGEPNAERVIRGPREGFTELLRADTALVRRRIKSPNLRLDSMEVGERSKTDIVVGYIEGLTNPELVREVKKRIEAIKTDILPDSGFLEQFIEDYPYSPFPQVQYTERPDRFAAGLSEGLVGILVDGSPLALMVPANMASFFQSPEDYYERAPFGGPLRLLRYVSGVLALLLPAVYAAVTTFHQEMLPTGLALTIAGTHMPVPFPAYVEALLMEVSLELIREAGVRLPDPVGQTMGFVGALLLGDAAVSAGLVSPIMVIVVAITGLASFAIPHYPTGLALRLLRFPLLLLGAGLGLYGVMAGVLAISLHLGSLTSFGVPYLEPLMKPRETVRDVIWRSPVFMFQRRPSYARPLDMIRQKAFIRTWSPGVAKRAQEAEEGNSEGTAGDTPAGGLQGQEGGSRDEEER